MAVIFVGLGGTGAAIVSKLYERYTNTPNRAPMGFLVYDADLRARPEKFPKNLFFATTNVVDNASNFCVKCMKEEKEMAEDFQKYWPGVRLGLDDKCKELGDFSTHGLGQSRPKGFLGLLRHLRENENIYTGIVDKSKELSNTTNIKEAAGQARIYLIGSFGGGTCSGCFLDLAFYLKSKLDNCRIYGYFLLGRAVMSNRVEIDSLSYDWACANTYGAYWELKFWNKEEREYKKRFAAGDDVSVTAKPFDNVFLFDLENSLRKNLNSYKEYEDLIVDVLYDTLIRQSVSTPVNTASDNITTRAAFGLGSWGRGIILYPKKDILRLLGFRVLRAYIEQCVTQENADEIRDQISRDLQMLGMVDDYSIGRDSIEQGMKDMKIQEIGKTVAFPKKEMIESLIKNLIMNMDRKDYENSIDVFVENFIKKPPEEIRNFLAKIHPAFLNSKKEKFEENLQQNIAGQGISFLHGYLSIWVSYLKEKIEEARKVNEDLKSSYDNAFNKLNENIDNIRNKQGGGRADKDALITSYKAYYKSLVAQLITIEKIAFYQEFIKFIEKLKDGVNFVQDFLKKVFLEEIRGNIIGYEQGIRTLYPSYPSELKVLPFATNNEFYEEIYKNVIKDGKSVINDNTKDVIKEFENYLIEEIFQEVIPALKQEENIYRDKDKIYIDIRKKAEELFDKLFAEKVPKTIFEAIFEEAKLRGYVNRDDSTMLDYYSTMINEYLNDLITTGENLASPFLVGEQESALPELKFIAGSNSALRDLIEEKQLRLDPGDYKEKINIDAKELDDMLIFIKAATGYGYDNIPSLKEPNGVYYKKYLSVIGNTDPQKRYEVFVDARYTPRGLPANLLFLIAEYAGIIVKRLDKQNNETGIYTFENQTFEKGIRGRAKNIQWFVNNEDPQKRGRIIDEIRKWWNTIIPDNRKQEFENIKASLHKNATNPNLSEDLRNIYAQNVKIMEDAIASNYYDMEDITKLL
ncbi:MAG: tubulin-like doman-containing protein [bacterium]